jgi:hypothetical protein
MAITRPGLAVLMIAATVLAGAICSVAASAPAAIPSADVHPQPEFGGRCALGMAEGKSQATDCSVQWVAAEGKVYCFSSEQNKELFLKDPQGNLERAREFSAAGEVANTGELMDNYKSADVESFVAAFIADTAARNAGIFPFYDAVTGQQLKLVFDHVDFVRTLHGYGFFPDVAFNAQDDNNKHYLVDFWIKPGKDKLQIVDTRIYKAPKRDGTSWTLQGRQPVPWWWIPASEHPGQTEQTRGWEVMSAVEADIVRRRADNQGNVKLLDTKTGEQLALEFIGSHQPVRRLQQDGRYFMCTDFRKTGTADQFYDVDFWVNEHGGKLTVDDVRVHKVPVKQEDGSWVQVPRYNFDDFKFDVVP